MIETIEVGTRKIAIKGIGKLFYQDGFPITMSIAELKEKGIEVSLLHVADELLKHGWTAKTVLSRLRNDAMEGISNEINTIDWDALEKFCDASYEEQREIIFQYLFGSSSQEAIQNKSVKEWFKNTIIK